VQKGEHDVAASGFERAVENEGVSIADAGVDHRVARRFREEGREFVADHEFGERELVGRIIHGGRRKAAGDRHVHAGDSGFRRGRG
jgi:hypothetical protein